MLQAILAGILVVLGSFGQIVAYFIFVTVAFIGLTVAGVVVLRKRNGPGTGYLVTGYPITPLAFLLLIAVLLFLLAADKPLQAFIGTAVVLLGLSAYRLFSQGGSITRERPVPVQD